MTLTFHRYGELGLPVLLQPGSKRFSLYIKFERECLTYTRKKLFVEIQFRQPLFGFDGHRLLEAFFRYVQAGEIQIRRARQESYRGLVCSDTPSYPLDYPLEHAHVFAVSGPEKGITATLSEPVHHEDARRVPESAAD